jgi:hypothetical protein
MNYCDSRITRLRDGSYLMLCWTFTQDEEVTRPAHRSVSSDGISWSTPESTTIQGQIATPVAIGESTVVAVSNVREGRQGQRLWISRDNGLTWDDTFVQLWDHDSQRLALVEGSASAENAERDAGVWENLQHFTFGSPDLVALGDSRVVLSYYVEVDGVVHVRACRLRIVE